MCDLVLKNANVFNAYFKRFIKGDVYIKDGLIFYVDYFNKPICADEEIDLKGAHISPGFIDIHMHIESSMLSPESFCNYLAKRGISTIVAEPHEIANVFGIKGIKAMLEASKNAPIDVFFGIPSSVPSTSTKLEGTGAAIDYEAMKELLAEPEAVCVGEVMNYKQVIKDDNNLEITKFLEYLRFHRPNFVIEGHCPKLIDEELAKFLYLGINADHTEHDLYELKQRYLMGMFVQLQAKMLRPELLSFIAENDLYHHTAFVTDDVMADTLLNKGHLDYVLKCAISKGFGVENTLYCATYTPACRMQLFDRGVIAPGKKADIVVFSDVNTLKIASVYKNGRLINQQPNSTISFANEFYHSLKIDKLSEDDFRLDAKITKTASKQISAKVLLVNDGTTQIKAKDEILTRLENGTYDKGSFMLGACFNRYGTKERGYALFGGGCIKKGAIATTWSHDHHNLFVLGANPADCALAANTLIECRGGIVAVENGQILALLKLPIAGILSDLGVEETAQNLANVRAAFRKLGYEHYNEIMSFGTLGLACSPFYKLTDKGLVDVSAGEIIKAFSEIS